MRILLTAHQFFPRHGSGTEVLTRDSGVEMLSRGHEVHVLTAEISGINSDDVVHEDYEYQGLKVRSLRIPLASTPADRIRREYDNELVARHVRRYLDEIQPDVAHIFHSARLSASIIDAFKEYGLPVVFTPTDFWAICVRNTLAKPSGELSTGPDDISSNCLECREAERLLPDKYLPKTEDKAEFYREIAERALAHHKREHPNMPLIRQMLARTEALRERFNSVDAILAPTKLMRDMLTTNGIDPKLVTLSPYGMKTGQLPEARHDRREPGRVRFGYVGTIHPQKGLHILIDAFKKLSPESDTTLRICGDFAHFPDYARQVYDLSRPDPRINFAGTFPNEQIAEELNKIDVLVVPSTWYENTPLVIYSAFAAKIPVVATNLGGMAEVVQHEENGLLFEPGDAEDLARQLRRLLEEPGMLSRFSGSLKEVRTIEDSVDEMLGVYGRLIERDEQERERMTDIAGSNVKPNEDWLWLNYEGIKENPELRGRVAPFPPGELKARMGGLSDLDFAAHGVHIYKALQEASPVPWDKLRVVLDHGCGSGRVARLFKDQGIELHGVDIDREYVAWLNKALPYMKAVAIDPNESLPYPDDTFDAIYQVSVLTHLDEEYQKGLLEELARVAKPGGVLFLTVHAERALEQATTSPSHRNTINVDEDLFQEGIEKFGRGEYAFVHQSRSYRNKEGFRYGISFIPSSYIRDNWTEWFDVLDMRSGAIHDWQDIVVLRAKPGKPSKSIGESARTRVSPTITERGSALVSNANRLIERVRRRISGTRKQPTNGTRPEVSKESRVSEHWARNVEARRSGNFAGNWLDHKTIQRLYINPMSTGSPDITWFDYVAKKYFPEPVEKALSLGCGGGALERHALSLGICESFDAYDISEGSVQAAREEAQKAGFSDRVNYATADLNNISLEENVYDAVFVSMAVHHLENLEHVYEELTKALKPGGLFVFNEFVGPSQFQWTEKQLELCDGLLASIPEEYRITEKNTVLQEIKRPTVQAMNELDPSESIRSAEIMPLTERYFDIVERRDYGGTLLHLVTMAGTIRNYSDEREEDVALMRRMIDFEKQHIETGEIGSDFTLVIARNRTEI